MTSILLYHQIAHLPAEQDPMGLAISPQVFEQQMAYLYGAGYQCLSLGEAVKRFRAGTPSPRKAIVITFDDGFRDLYSTIWPILHRFNFTATIFLVAGCAGCNSDWEGQNGNYAVPLLDWSEVRELAQAGFTFASHTVSHPHLTELSDEQVKYEVQQSKAMMEDQLEMEVNLFSYPYSSQNSRIQHIVAESGYIAACGVDRGDWGLFNLWRAQCTSSDSLFSFALKASGWYHRLIWIREQCRAYPLLYRSGQRLKHLLKNRVIQ